MTTPRELVAYSIILLFGFALLQNPSDQMMVGALIGAFSTAIGYYLGAAKRDDHAQPVTVENTPADPVPVKGGE